MTSISDTFTADDIRAMLRHVAPRPEYERWIRIIGAVRSVLPLEEAAHVLDEWSPEERRGEYVQKIRHPMRNVGIGTLIHYAQQGGYDAKEAARRRHELASGGVGRARLHRTLAATKPAPPASTQSTQTGANMPAHARHAADPSSPAAAIKWPKDMHPGDGNELYTLADVREIPGTEGLEAATASGHLHFATLPDAASIEGVGAAGWAHRPAWILTDSSRRVALARRLDGQDWCHVGAKGWTLKGSQGNWPIGAADIDDAPTVGLVEGGPDFLCLWHLIALEGEEWMPVCMPSACPIAPEALPYFHGRDVRLFPHHDYAGGKALKQWASQLREAGAASVRFFDFARYHDTAIQRPPKDLNKYIIARAAGRLVPAPPANPANFQPTTL